MNIVYQGVRKCMRLYKRLGNIVRAFVCLLDVEVAVAPVPRTNRHLNSFRWHAQLTTHLRKRNLSCKNSRNMRSSTFPLAALLTNSQDFNFFYIETYWNLNETESTMIVFFLITFVYFSSLFNYYFYRFSNV